MFISKGKLQFLQTNTHAYYQHPIAISVILSICLSCFLASTQLLLLLLLLLTVMASFSICKRKQSVGGGLGWVWLDEPEGRREIVEMVR